MKNTNYVFLVGMMCSGKTTIGKHLAELIGYNYLDTDQEIKRMYIFDNFRKMIRRDIQKFHGMERDAMTNALRSRTCVISTGGRTFLWEGNRKFIAAKGVSVYINTPPRTIYNRLTQSELDKRELPKPRFPLWFLVPLVYYWRLKHYTKADIIVNGDQPPEKIALDIAMAVEGYKNDSLEKR